LFEILLLIAAVTAIVSYARARGGNPWVWGVLAGVGYLVVPIVVVFVAAITGVYRHPTREQSQFWFFVVAIAWIALLAFCARFLLGLKRSRPGGMWSCPHCKYLSQPCAVICEACRQPYGTNAPPAP